jgi:hypothetical protein
MAAWWSVTFTRRQPSSGANIMNKLATPLRTLNRAAPCVQAWRASVGELSFTSFRHGGFTEGADSDLTDAELRAAGRHRSTRQLPTYAKRTRKQLISGTKKRREERTKAAGLSE